MESYNARGEKIWEAEYDIYGKVRKHKGEKNFIPFRQLGQYEDGEVALYYNRFRYYDAEQGNYISQDPIGLAGGTNLYSYVSDTNKEIDLVGWITVYRALNGKQESQALSNEPILPKNSSANYSIQQHIDDGSLETQYISTTKQQHTAEFYAKPNPKRGKMASSTIIAIDTDKLDSGNVFDVSNGIDPQSGQSLKNPAQKWAMKDAEVLIEGSIPSSAYTIFKKGGCH